MIKMLYAAKMIAARHAGRQRTHDAGMALFRLSRCRRRGFAHTTPSILCGCRTEAHADRQQHSPRTPSRRWSLKRSLKPSRRVVASARHGKPATACRTSQPASIDTHRACPRVTKKTRRCARPARSAALVRPWSMISNEAGTGRIYEFIARRRRPPPCERDKPILTGVSRRR